MSFQFERNWGDFNMTYVIKTVSSICMLIHENKFIKHKKFINYDEQKNKKKHTNILIKLLCVFYSHISQWSHKAYSPKDLSNFSWCVSIITRVKDKVN